MAEQLLDRADVITVLQQMRGKRMAKRMWLDLLINLCQVNRVPNDTLENAFMNMMPHCFSSLWVYGALTCRKDILPAKFAVGIWIFALQRVRKMNFSVPFTVPL
jgi:hypothetical protein